MTGFLGALLLGLGLCLVIEGVAIMALPRRLARLRVIYSYFVIPRPTDPRCGPCHSRHGPCDGAARPPAPPAHGTVPANDGAEPAATSVAVLNLLVLSHLTGDAAMADQVTKTFGTLGASASMRGRGVPMMLAALSTYHAGVPQIVIVGDPVAGDTRALTEVVRHHYMPTAVVVPISDAQREALSRLLPWTSSMRQKEGRATVYVCRDFSCQTPTTSVDELDAQLEGITHT